jgi:RND family efflux transporter MFP subunit
MRDTGGRGAEQQDAAQACKNAHFPSVPTNQWACYMTKKNDAFVPYVLALMLALSVAACNGSSGKSDTSGGAGPALLIAPEDIYPVSSRDLGSGPSITGSVQPERRADLRAEVSAVVLSVLKENGDAVRRGDLLVRLDDTAIRDALTSAEASARAAEQAFDQAERQFQRMKTLRTSGMASTQQLEDAEIRRNTAQSDREAAKSRMVQARQQLQRTEARAPFDGIVSERKVSAGDTAQIGQELLKVIDPHSLRFEGLVSADRIGSVRAGQTVVFRVSGYGGQEFTGKVRRVNPAANATTRQIEVLVDFADARQPKLAGLYAEGYVETEKSNALAVPDTVLVHDGDKSYAWRLGSGVLQKVDVAIGERDPRSGEFAVKKGLAEGDRVLRHPTTLLKDGQKVEMTAAAAAADAAPVPTAASNGTK